MNGDGQNSFKTDARRRPLYMAAVVLLFACACVLFPVSFLEKHIGSFAALSIVRLAFGSLGVGFMILFGFSKGLKLHKSAFKYWDVLLVLTLVSIINFPLFAFFLNEASITAGQGQIWLFVLFCISVGFFEEIFFRGLLLTLLLIRFGKDKKGQFIAIALSSVIFGTIHLFNLFAGESLGNVALQIGYSALLAAGWGALYIFTKSVWFGAVLHALFNIGGLMVEYLGTGEIWNTAAVVTTALTGILAAGVVTYRFFKTHEI